MSETNEAGVDKSPPRPSRTSLPAVPASDDAGTVADARARRLARRIVFGSFLLLSTAFVVSSAWQLIRGIYAPGSPIAPVGASAPSTAAACADGVAKLTTALDRAFAAATTKDDEAAALKTLSETMQPEWSEQAAVEATCAQEARGQDAYAALLRLRMAEEVFVRRQIAEIAPVRRDVRAYLPR